MLKDVSLLQERVNGLPGRLRRLTGSDAKMMIQGMAAGQLDQDAL
ncbi:hypothetical protein [Rhizobium herbae]